MYVPISRRPHTGPTQQQMGSRCEAIGMLQRRKGLSTLSHDAVDQDSATLTRCFSTPLSSRDLALHVLDKFSFESKFSQR